MTARRAGIAVAIAHVLLVGTLGLKLLADRTRLPRAWVRTLPFDPSLPIRGRYVRLRLEVPLAGAPGGARAGEYRQVRLETAGERLRGVLDDAGPHVSDPSLRPTGEELWAEVTVPPRGPPRPIRLAVRRAGTPTPLEIH